MEQQPDLVNYSETPQQTNSLITQERKDIANIPSLRRRLLALVGFPMAWFFTQNYLEAPRGFYQALFWPIFLSVALWFLSDSLLKQKNILVILSGAAVLSGSIHSALYASLPLSSLNFLLLPILSVFTLILATQKYADLTLRPFLSTLNSLLTGHLRILFFLPTFFKRETKTSKNPESRQTRHDIFKGILITLPLVFILLILLSGSDVAFGKSLDRIVGDLLNNFRLTNIVSRILVSLIALLYFLGVILSIRNNRTQPPMIITSHNSQSPIISLIILGSVNVLYALFTFTQLRTLYFPKTQLTAMNQGISNYARSGFFNLLLVLMINLLLLWFLSTFTRKSENTEHAMKAGYVLMFLFTANMIASSFYKMALYESEFGYTHLRLFVKFALVFFTLGLIILLLFVLKRITSILRPLTLLALSLYIILNFINLDGIIARRSYEIYSTNGRLDVAYLSNLSADASSSMEKSFHFESTTDVRILELKNQYFQNLDLHLNGFQLTSHPLAQTITELQIKP